MLGVCALGWQVHQALAALERADRELTRLSVERARLAGAAARVDALRKRVLAADALAQKTRDVLASAPDAAGHARRLREFIADSPGTSIVRFEMTRDGVQLKFAHRRNAKPEDLEPFADALAVSPFRRRLQLDGVRLHPVEVEIPTPQDGCVITGETISVPIGPPECCSYTDPWGVKAEALALVLEDFPMIKAEAIELLPNKAFVITLDVTDANLREVARLRDALKTSDLARGRSLSVENTGPASRNARRSGLRLRFAYPASG